MSCIDSLPINEGPKNIGFRKNSIIFIKTIKKKKNRYFVEKISKFGKTTTLIASN